MELCKDKIAQLFQKKWKMIAITFSGRSGSFFLQSVLNGHSQILDLPMYITSMYKRYIADKRYAWRNIYIYRDKLSIKAIPSLFKDFIDNSMDPSKYDNNKISSGPTFNFFGENKDKVLAYDQTKFLHILDQIMAGASSCSNNNTSITIHRKYAFLSIFFAFNLTIGKSINDLLNTKYLMFQMHDFDFDEMKTIKKDFDDLIYMVSIREPVSGLISHIQAFNDMLETQYLEQYYYDNYMARAFKQIFYEPYIPEFMDKSSCITVKNEYLHLYQDVYVKKILDYLELPWEDICSKSTFNGEIFWWRFGDKYKTGYNKNFKWRICDKLNASCRDKQFISHLLKDKYEQWGYQPCPVYKTSLNDIINNGFDFYKHLNLSPYIQHSFNNIILDYYHNSFAKPKEFVPCLDFNPETEKIECTYEI